MTEVQETFRSIVTSTLEKAAEEVRTMGTDSLHEQKLTLKHTIAEVGGALNLLEELQMMVEREQEEEPTVDHPRPTSQLLEDDGFPEHNVADLIRWDQITKGVEVPF